MAADSRARHTATRRHRGNWRTSRTVCSRRQTMSRAALMEAHVQRAPGIAPTALLPKQTFC
ncbi:hypothetical protein CDN99_21670 [Roseateles aquatilis]|uniref:Uncharacterized protein n=1 Tax=Roseateles aquatilis TaxID=431061 RepID=A0A246IZC0_9BURK|nr:hypothetical protein [Roseateles aquatilis]OWQ85689.1 hypothetical protein CDN99_21670 [Roseateles aquatilis]